MQITVSAETMDELELKAHRLGRTTDGYHLARVVNALFEHVPEDVRQQAGIRYVATGSGTWSSETRVVVLHGETEDTLQKCAVALGVSEPEAFAQAVSRLVAPAQIFPG